MLLKSQPRKKNSKISLIVKQAEPISGIKASSKGAKAAQPVDLYYWPTLAGGRTGHFRRYSPDIFTRAIDRYTGEVNRLHGVMSERLKGNGFLAGAYACVELACWPWGAPWKNQGQNRGDFEYFKKWVEWAGNRPTIQSSQQAGRASRQASDLRPQAQARLIAYSQKTRK